MANNFKIRINGKEVKVVSDHIYVDGHDTYMRLWEGNSTKYINTKSGDNIGRLKGKKLEDALVIEGWL
jgi:hypothetical protein